MSEHVFITLSDTNEILVYANGIYLPGRKLILKIVQEKLGQKAKRSYGSEVEYYIKNVTQIDRSLINRDKYSSLEPDINSYP